MAGAAVAQGARAGGAGGGAGGAGGRGGAHAPHRAAGGQLGAAGVPGHRSGLRQQREVRPPPQLQSTRQREGQTSEPSCGRGKSALR